MSKKPLRSLSYTLTIGGNKMNSEELAYVVDVKVEDVTNGSDILTVAIFDPDFKYIGNESLFVEDQTVSFRGGWSDELDVKFDGYISVVDLDFPDVGFPRLILHCMDNTHLMNRKEKKRTWEKMYESDVVAKIFKEYGFKAKIDKTKVKEDTISQSDKTDIEFLIELAGNQEEEYIVYVEGDKGYFIKKPSVSTSKHKLVYRDFPHDITSFTPRINKEKKKEEVEKANIDVKTKKTKKAVVNKSNSKSGTKGKPVSTSSKKVSSPKPSTSAKAPSKVSKNKGNSKPSKNSNNSNKYKKKYVGNGKWVNVIK